MLGSYHIRAVAVNDQEGGVKLAVLFFFITLERRVQWYQSL